MKKTNEINTTIKQAIKDMTKELGLNQYPTVKIESGNTGYVMAADGTMYTASWLDKRIIKTECKYVLRINKDVFNRTLKRYAIMFGNKQAAYDWVYLLVCHELRHMWQYQGDFFVGKIHDSLSANITEMFYGHGANDEEADANQWMIRIAEKKGIKDLATYMELEQRTGGLFSRDDTSFKQNAISAFKDTTEIYNKSLYNVYRVLLRLFVK